MNLWNVKDLNLPPRNTYKAKNQDVDIKLLRNIISEAFGTFKNDSQFKEEAALLSRIIYRMKLKFRHDKGLKAMEKMNRALLQYLRMHVPQMLESLYGMVPQAYTQNTYLPTLNMLHYVMVRIQGLAKLLVRVVECAKVAGLFMQNRIAIGHLWKASLVCFTVVSKIFVLTQQLTKYCCKFYNALYPFTKTLQNSGIQWLPDGYNLPDDLKVWLNVDWLEQKTISLPKSKKLKIPTVFHSLDEDSDVEYCGEYREVEDDIDFVDEYIQINESVTKPALLKTEDVGEVVDEIEIPKEKERLNKIQTGVKNSEENKTEFSILKVENGVKVLDKDKISKKRKNKNKPQNEGRPIEKDEPANLRITKNKNCKRNIEIEQTGENPQLKRKKLNQNVLFGDETVNNQQKRNVNATDLIENIRTLADLKNFNNNFTKLQKERPGIFKNMDKLQQNRLHNSIKQLVLKADRKHCDIKHVNVCVKKAKKVLRGNIL